eukprot:2037458-Rhodomonas_salina.1
MDTRTPAAHLLSLLPYCVVGDGDCEGSGGGACGAAGPGCALWTRVARTCRAVNHLQISALPDSEPSRTQISSSGIPAPKALASSLHC